MSESAGHTCRYCGKPTDNFSRYSPVVAAVMGVDGVAICDECAHKSVDFLLWKNEQEGDEIVCPWCGYMYPDSWEITESDPEFECPRCGRTFELTVEYSSTFIAKRRTSDYPGELPPGYRKECTCY